MAAYELKKSVAKVGEKAMSFAFYKGKNSDQIVIGVPPSAALIKEMEKECGKTARLFKGVCFREETTLVFATKAAPAPAWKAQIAKVLKARKCQGVSDIELRQLGAGESDDASAESEGGADEAEGALKDGEGTGATLGAAEVQALAAQWTGAREAAVRGVQELVGKLKATGDEDAAEAGAVVLQIAAKFPTGLDQAFAKFEKAAGAADPALLSAARATTKAQTEACLGFLKSNQKLIGLCEGNPFEAKVAISEPLTQALLSISSRLD